MMTRSDSNDLTDSPVHAFPELDPSCKRNDDEEDDALAVDGSIEGEVVAGSPRLEPVVADDAVTLPPRDVSGRSTPQATELSGVSEHDNDADEESGSSEEAPDDAVQDVKPVSPASVVAASVPTYRLDESMEEIHLHDASGTHVVPTLIGEPLTENGGLGYIPVAEATVVSPSHVVQASVISVPPTPASPKFDEVSLFISARCGEFTQILTRLRDDDSKWKMVLSARDADGHSVLHWAALFDAADFISAACSRADKSFVDARSTNGQTPLMWCCIKGNLKSLKLLYHRFHADLTAVDTLKADCGVLAVQHHQHNVLLLLYKWRKDEAGRHPFEWADVSGCTAAHWAAYKGDTLMLRILLYVKTDLDVVDAQGMTPLHRAVSEGWNETAAFLVDTAGCNKHAKNAKGESPVDIAKRLENWALMYTLRETDACGDDKCKKSHAKKNAHDGPMGSGRWGLPAIFTACLSCLIITFFADLYSTASGVLSTGFISCVLIVMYLYTGLLTGDPGAVPKRLPGNSAIEELQDKLDDVNTTIAPGEGVNKICFTCWENKDVNLRIKHCAVCNSCFEGFDHHCGWINNCVAEKNHKRFVVMVFAVFIGQLLFLAISISAFVNSDLSFIDHLWMKPLMVPSWLILLLVVPWMAVLTFHQARTIALNLNTNEMINMNRYAHFWEGSMTAHAEPGHPHRVERKFKNPFDQGGMVENCKHFWFRKGKRYTLVNGHEVEMAQVV